MSIEPPPFQEASRCDVCKCSFNTFRRRHHCRCCGRTLCAEHSSNQMALPQFGLHSNVRVCADCFNDAPRLTNDGTLGSTSRINSITDSVSKLDIQAVEDTNIKQIGEQVQSISECKCGMPLCICEAPAPPKDVVVVQGQTSSTVHSNPKPQRAGTTQKNRSSTSNSKTSSGQVTNSSSESSAVEYEANGEGLREAIKNGDTVAAINLLSRGVDANYRDKQGSSLLHLAAVFNQTQIAFALMENGASLDCKNSQGETPLDCAQATLQYKMKEKMKELEQMKTQAT